MQNHNRCNLSKYTDFCVFFIFVPARRESPCSFLHQTSPPHPSHLAFLAPGGPPAHSWSRKRTSSFASLHRACFFQRICHVRAIHFFPLVNSASSNSLHRQACEGHSPFHLNHGLDPIRIHPESLCLVCQNLLLLFAQSPNYQPKAHVPCTQLRQPPAHLSVKHSFKPKLPCNKSTHLHSI